jgi:hypothetical protein
MDTFSKDAESHNNEWALQIRDYLAQVITVIQSDAIDAKSVTNLYHTKQHERQFKNEFVLAGDQQLILIAETTYTNLDPHPTALIYFWNNYLWPLYTLTFWWKDIHQDIVCFRAYLPVDSTELELLLSKPTQVILLRNGRIDVHPWVWTVKLESDRGG